MDFSVTFRFKYDYIGGNSEVYNAFHVQDDFTSDMFLTILTLPIFTAYLPMHFGLVICHKMSDDSGDQFIMNCIVYAIVVPTIFNELLRNLVASFLLDGFMNFVARFANCLDHNFAMYIFLPSRLHE